jgi:hypothetical protein
MMKLQMLPRIGLFIFLLFSSRAYAQCPSYHVIYVDSSVSVSGDGSSWATAFKTLKQAIDTAIICTNLDTIHVAKGTYYPTGNQSGTDRNASFSLRNNLAILGGYPSGGGVRSPLINTTLLSGNISGTNVDNSFHVIHISNVDQTAVLDGFTITGGQAANAGPMDPGFPNNIGGGMYSENSSGTFVNCTFTGNGAFLKGGGVYAVGGHLHFDHCSWINQGAEYGGGMFLNKAEATINYANFDANFADENGGLGGGIMMDSSKIWIYHSNFSNNGALITGGAIYAKNLSELTIDSSTFINNPPIGFSILQSKFKMTNSNVANYPVALSGMNATIENCDFQNHANLSIICDSSRVVNCQFDYSSIDINSMGLIENCVITHGNNPGIETSGGNTQIVNTSVSQCNSNGLYLHAPTTVKNCTIEQNTGFQGGGVLIENTTPYFENCVIAANSASEGGGIYMSIGAGGQFVNCVLTQNQAVSSGGACFGYYQTESTFTNCTIEGNTAPNGTGGFYFNTIWYHLLNMSNSIVWNNGTSFQSNDFANTTININHSIIDGASVYAGIGNSNANPQFANASNKKGVDAMWRTADDGLSITACSPAINAGDTITQPSVDITSFPRAGIFDNGAYEYQGQGLTLPMMPGLYTANAIVAMGSRLHYIDCANNYLILTLDTSGSGAIIPADSVTTKVGIGATFYPTGTGFVQQVPGEIYFNREWDVRALQQPTSGNVDVFMYYTMADFNAVQDSAQQHGMVGPSFETELDFYKVKTPGLPAYPAISSLQSTDIIRIENGTQPDTNMWFAGSFTNHTYAHFKVASFSGGGGGLMHKLFPLPMTQLDLQGYWQHGMAFLTYNIHLNGELNTFELEQSRDGIRFTTAKNVLPTWKSTQDAYSLQSTMPFQSTYFRMKAIQADGNLLYSPVVLIQDKGDNYFQLYPNPSNGILHIKSFINKSYQVTIVDMYGKICFVRELNSTLETLDLGTLSKGLYQVQLKQGNQVMHYKLELY